MSRVLSNFRLSFPQRGKVASGVLQSAGCRMRERPGLREETGNGLREETGNQKGGFSLITLQCAHWRELPPLGEALPAVGAAISRPLFPTLTSAL